MHTSILLTSIEMLSARKFRKTLHTSTKTCSERKLGMNHYEFFQKILTQLNEIQTALNTLRATIKQEIQNGARARGKEERENLR
jgi:hypothetical protein